MQAGLTRELWTMERLYDGSGKSDGGLTERENRQFVPVFCLATAHPARPAGFLVAPVAECGHG
jgi:hypothetical protein